MAVEHGRRFVWGLVALFIIASIAAITVPKEVALAYSGDGCSPGRTGNSTDYDDGWQEMPGDGVLGGATVTADTYVPDVGTDDASLWSMLVNSTSPDIAGFTQVGYRLPSGSLEFFVEEENVDGSIISPLQVYPSGSGITVPAAGSTYSYNTLYSPSSDEYTFTINVGGTNYPAYASTNEDGFTANTQIVFYSGDAPAGLGWLPYGVEIFGETHSLSDQMFGDSVYQEDLSSSGFYSSGWQSMGGSPDFSENTSDTVGYHYLNSGSGDNDLAIWDNGCPASVTSADQYMDVGQVLDAAGTGSAQELESDSGDTNGPYSFVSQTDGNFVLYDSRGYALWSTATASYYPDYLTLQSDGNCVLYNAHGGSDLFNTGTSGDSAEGALTLQGNGDLELYGEPANEDLLWSSGSQWDSTNSGLFYGQSIDEGTNIYSYNGLYFLALQTDGNLVLYTSTGTALWDTGTSNGAGNILAMQTDGNLVLYNSAGHALWDSGTSFGDYGHMVVNTNGQLIVSEINGSTAWAS